MANFADNFRETILSLYPFIEGAKDYLRDIPLIILDKADLRGGGAWYPTHRKIELNGLQHEAAIHEMAHAIWQDIREHLKNDLVAAVLRFSQDKQAAIEYSKMANLAWDYAFGIPLEPGFQQGMLLPTERWGEGGGHNGMWNDWEMFAGFASGCMADISLLPPYLRIFYQGTIFEMEEVK